MLKGIKVVDFSKWLPGQYCGMMLADYGADVIKVESPKGDDPRRFTPQIAENMSYWHMMLNRNKRDVVVDLKTPEGVAALTKLLQDADVFLEGFRAGYLAQFGLDYESVKKINPRLIYVSITGFGQKSHKPGHDLNVIGLASLSGLDDGTEIALPDLQMSALTGSTNAFATICMCLFNREKTGLGRHLDVSLYASGLNMKITGIAAMYGCDAQKCKPFSRVSHYYGVYQCKDGRYMTVGTIEPKFWNRLCDLIECPELKERQFDFDHEKDLIKIIGDKFKTKTQAEWLALIGDEEFCVTPILTMREALNSELTKEQNILMSVQDKDFGELHYIGYPVKISDYEQKTPQRAQWLGESNELLK